MLNKKVFEDIDFFFRQPEDKPNIPDVFSQLYLLRRDISTCFGIDPTSKEKISTQAIWPGVMAICTGIDLLGKFYAGNDIIRKVGERFKNFLNIYFHLSENDSIIIYNLRNSLIHSFGLYSEFKNNNGDIITYRYSLIQGINTFIRKIDNEKFLIDVNIFYNMFENAVNEYESQLRRNKILQKNFTHMFPKHSGIRIG